MYTTRNFNSHNIGHPFPGDFDFIDYAIDEPSRNMAIDEALLLSVKNGSRHAVFRIYGWTHPAITMGYFQQAQSINFEQCRINDVPVIRRITGGRAIYHQNEITYAFAFSVADDLKIQKTKIFSHFSQIIISGLNGMGIKAKISSRNSTGI